MGSNVNVKRVQVRLSNEVYAKLKEWSLKLGVTMGQLGGMAVTSGLDSILRAVSPVDSLTPEQWAKISQAIEDNKVKQEELSKYGR